MLTRIAVAAFFGMASLVLPALVHAEDRPAGSLLRAEILNLRSNEGQVGCQIFSSADGFPSDSKKAVQSFFVRIKDKTAACEFRNLPPGTYAIAAMHDENGDGKMETNFFGIPKEGHGVSQEAKMERIGGPRFSEASLVFKGGSETVRITLHY